MSEIFAGLEILQDAEILSDLAVALLAGLGATAFLLRSRALERRIFSIETSLGAFASLGGNGGDPLDDEQVLRYLEAMSSSLLGELKTTADPVPKSAKES